eukprot:733452-Hanusia_phi.AAC.2
MGTSNFNWSQNGQVQETGRFSTREQDGDDEYTMKKRLQGTRASRGGMRGNGGESRVWVRGKARRVNQKERLIKVRGRTRIVRQ